MSTGHELADTFLRSLPNRRVYEPIVGCLLGGSTHKLEGEHPSLVDFCQDLDLELILDPELKLELNLDLELILILDLELKLELNLDMELIRNLHLELELNLDLELELCEDRIRISLLYDWLSVSVLYRKD